ncbi:S8 family serine peptidase [Patescibacteria group bacterium]|nr:S8 family serine peptidase [Patescibacteria group bacterium]MBU4453145.1 S8 family serine peptidase [Patescibacteria group bacterium]MCG2687354.1 S8 family serine peptidase [Candidatus Parcubacteria bacterium]
MSRRKQTIKRIITAGILLCMFPAFVFAKSPNDVEYDEQWYLDMISAPEAWDIETGDSSVVIAVLDTGVDLNHPDLVGNIWVNTGEVAGNGIDDDHNGFIDDVNGWDFIDSDNTPVPDVSSGANEDAISHGTVISGLIAAVGNNQEGVAGVMWNASIMSVRMLDKTGSGNSVDARNAIDYAVASGADVINLSFSGTTNDPALRKAVMNAYNNGVVVVSALGNDGVSVNSNPVYPACYKDGDDDWVIGVAASDSSDQHSLFSNYGSNCVDLSAPGEYMYGLHYYDPSGGFTQMYMDGWSGTSVASPIVAGAAGLLLSKYPYLSPADVRNILKLSVDPMSLSGVYRGQFGAGRLNIKKALVMAGQFPHQEDEIVPVQTQIAGIMTGDYIKSPSFPSVYYIDESGGRRVFLDVNSYFTWSTTFADIKTVTDDELALFDFSGLMLPKYGVVLVKIQSDSSVYYLERGNDSLVPVLRRIGSEDVAVEMFGENWSDYVIDIEPTFFTKFELGQSIDEAFAVDTSIMKTREQLSNLAK